MDLSEDELIEAIRRILAGPDPRVLTGIGDDAAVVEPGPGSLVLTTDALVDGVHFERASTAPRELGERSIAVNVSDLAAMGASPRHALVALVLDDQVEPSWLVELAAGMRAAADVYALSVVGGDLNRGATLTIAVTAVGEVAPGRAVLRSGARPGDDVVVTGALGAAAGGLALARAPADRVAPILGSEAARALTNAFARPLARVAEGQVLARAGATAMIDVSDGLLKDLARLCAASGVGARIDPGAVPAAPELVELAGPLGLDARETALAGGDDYELLAAMPSEATLAAAAELRDALGVTLTVIGSIIEGSGPVAAGPDGRDRPLGARGWDHFDA